MFEFGACILNVLNGKAGATLQFLRRCPLLSSPDQEWSGSELNALWAYRRVLQHPLGMRPVVNHRVILYCFFTLNDSGLFFSQPHNS
jgi:hypothetical protein